mmetsp:Transcript_14180/g.33575  ORF Transcript_14180/g.33575 Transcript_14180/m.33575 type:complete len:481 (+) Transcript_14180:121-1563(+)
MGAQATHAPKQEDFHIKIGKAKNLEQADILQRLHAVGLLSKVWPYQRVILGMQVCKWLRRDLGLSMDKCVLILSAQGLHEDNFAKALRRIECGWITIRLRGYHSYTQGKVGGFEDPLAQIAAAFEGSKERGCAHTIERLELDGGFEAVPAGGWVKLCSSLQYCSNILHLNLSSKGIYDEAATALGSALGNCTKLQTLDLSNNRIGDTGGERIAEAIGKCKSLRRINLQGGEMGAEAIQILATVLPGCTGLATLNLGQNKIGPIGAVGLAKAIQSLRSLEKLHLKGNALGAEGVRAIGKAWHACERLTLLDVGHNNLRRDGVHTLACGLPGPMAARITHLNLFRNRIQDPGVVRLATLLRACTALTHLNLSANGISNAGLRALVEQTESFPALTTLDMSHNLLGEHVDVVQGSAIDPIAKLLRQTPVLKHLDLSTNKLSEAAPTRVTPDVTLKTLKTEILAAVAAVGTVERLCMANNGPDL